MGIHKRAGLTGRVCVRGRDKDQCCVCAVVYFFLSVMASTSSSLSEEQFTCSICQDVFKDPATVPCGHNFCIECISRHWNSSIESKCPLCNKDFHLRPELDINREFRGIIEKLMRGESPLKPGDLPCDACEKIKRRALKSCVDCGGTFCKTHLEPHNIVAQLKKHKLIDPCKNLKDYMCQKHDKPLELFCRDDQVCLCLYCVMEEHKSHNTALIGEESAYKKSQLGIKQAEIREMIKDKTKRTEEIKIPVKLNRQKIEKEKAYCFGLFTDLMKSIKKCHSEVLDLMEKKQVVAEGLIREMEKEIFDLKKRNVELGKLSDIEDHIHFLRIYTSLCSPLKCKNWSEINIYTDTSDINVDTVRIALTKHQEFLHDVITNNTGNELMKIRKFAVNMTMDPQTAHPKLRLSEDDKQAVYTEIRQDVPDSPMRFDICPGVLGKEKFSGKFYFEVQVKGKTEWDLGVARESVERKGTITLSPRNGLWTVALRNGSELKACDIPSVSLSLRAKPQMVGVFVDHEKGLVSFYDVKYSSHIYSFTDQCFAEELYPYFSPCFNNGDIESAPLVILPVSN